VVLELVPLGYQSTNCIDFGVKNKSYQIGEFENAESAHSMLGGQRPGPRASYKVEVVLAMVLYQ
jgi:hypothetical protein